MIIYFKNVKEFLETCQRKDELAQELVSLFRQKLSRAVGKSEEDSWKLTLVKISKLLINLKDKEKTWVLLEYKLPAKQNRIDVMLVGKDHRDKKLIDIIELKGWSDVNEDPQSNKMVIANTRRGIELHPSEQAREYETILGGWYSDVGKNFYLTAWSYLPNLNKNPNPLNSEKFSEILNVCKTYSAIDNLSLDNYFQEKFVEGIEKQEIEKHINDPEYRPSKTLLESWKTNLESIHLIGSQNIAYEKIIRRVNIYNNNKNLKKEIEKRVIVISGVPGSGKTLIALKVLQYVKVQKNLAKVIFPGIEFRDSIAKNFSHLDSNLFIGGSAIKSHCEIAIIDEAHKAGAQGVVRVFFRNEVCKHVDLAICLIDDMQVVNKKGMTISELEKICQEKNYQVERLDLTETFRNSGDSTYIAWLKYWIFNEKCDDDGNQQFGFVRNTFDFRVFYDVNNFVESYKKDYSEKNVRMVSEWRETWIIEKVDQYGMPIKNLKIGNEFFAWNPNNEWYKRLQEHDIKNMSKDLTKLVEKNFITEKKGWEYIGYFNTVQGSEFDCIYVHVPDIYFLNENKELDVDLSKLNMREMRSQIWAETSKTYSQEHNTLNKLYFKNRLIVNLTRGIFGCYVYCEDKKLNEYLKNMVKSGRKLN